MISSSNTNPKIESFSDKSFSFESDSFPEKFQKHEKNIYPKQFHEKYIMTNIILGSGSSCTVKKCVNKITHKQYAVKIINKHTLTKNTLKSVRTETIVLEKIKKMKKSNYLIHLEDVYETSKYIFYVLELCNGYDLCTWMKNRIDFQRGEYIVNEKIVAFIFYQIVKAVHLCHKHGIIHRDLKPDNILFTSKHRLNLKVSDFGLSYICHQKNYEMRTKCGTPYYIAPEILINDTYDIACDWWTCGVILYLLLSGCFPFFHENFQRTYELICTDDPNFSGPQWENVSGYGRDLCAKLLNKNPKNRYKYHDIIHHPFFETNLTKKKKPN